MDIFSLEYLTALLAIIGIDLVLAGDNAILIALIARKLPSHQQRLTIIAGTAGAVVVRVAMTLAVVSLLNIPWLLLTGGVLLAWIAYRLLAPDKPDPHVGKAVEAVSLGSAIRTIVVADAVMGLDNVLGVAGAAQGDFSLVVIGLAISVPIMVAGSTIILRYVERYPVLIYIGAAILAWTAAKMIHHEPAIAQWWERFPLLPLLLYGVVIGGVVASGLWRGTPVRGSVAGQAPAEPEDRPHALPFNQSETNMLNILIPVDGSPDALQAVQYAIGYHELHDEPMTVNLINVQPSLPRYVTRFVHSDEVRLFEAERAEKALADAIALLTEAGMPHTVFVNEGDIAQAIISRAKEVKCHKIVMGTTRKNAVVRFFEGSILNKVMEQTDIPVEVIARGEASRMERFGIPAGIGVALGFMWLATE